MTSPSSVGPLTGLRWAIKRSFLDYVGRARGGSARLGDGALATAQKEVVFGLDPALPPVIGAESTFLAFRGSITFNAYSGVLFVRITNPQVTIRGNRGELTVVDPFASDGDTRLRLAEFRIDDHLIDEGFAHWAATDVRLAPEGRELFNDVYVDGEPMEPITIIIPHET